MLGGLHRAFCIVLFAVIANGRVCQEATKTFFEFNKKADYASGIQLPLGSEITFVFESFLGLYKFKSKNSLDGCNIEEASAFGLPGEGHKAYTLPVGTHFFALENYCRQGRKLTVNILPCAPCDRLFFDSPFGFGLFERAGGSAWVSKDNGHSIRRNGEAWQLSVGKHTFESTSTGAPDHPHLRALWRHDSGIEFDIVLHCDVCEDDPKMECLSVEEAYCYDETYVPLMRMRCPHFCGFCDLMYGELSLTSRNIEVHIAQNRNLPADR